MCFFLPVLLLWNWIGWESFELIARLTFWTQCVPSILKNQAIIIIIRMTRGKERKKEREQSTHTYNEIINGNEIKVIIPRNAVEGTCVQRKFNNWTKKKIPWTWTHRCTMHDRKLTHTSFIRTHIERERDSHSRIM